MVIKNAKTDKLMQGKKYAKGDTSYSSFWLYNKERDIDSEAFKDTFVDFYNDKELLSEFNPTVAKNIISFWSKEGDTILDPFSGRTRALVSCVMKRNYIGYEISKDVIEYMNVKFESLNIPKLDVRNKDCIEINNDFEDNSVDFVFSCPPYWDLEKYESCDGQLSDVKDYDEFMNMLYDRLSVSVDKLKPNRYMCMVVGDFRRKGDYITFHSDLIEKMKERLDIKLHDVIITQNIPFGMAAYYFGSRRKNDYTAKAHEYIIIWKKKGDKKEYINNKKIGSNDERRLSVFEADGIAKERGGKCLSKPSEYKNCDTSKLKFECFNKHRWEATIGSVKHTGTWCPKCKTGVNENICRNWFEYIFNVSFNSHRPDWLIGPSGRRMELDGYNKKLGVAFEYNGKQHYEKVYDIDLEKQQDRDQLKQDLCIKNRVKLFVIPHDIKRDDIGQYIKSLLLERGFNVKDIDCSFSYKEFDNYKNKFSKNFELFVKKRGWKLLDNYIDSHTKVKIKCDNGHLWNVQPRAIKNGNKCPYCSKKVKYTLDDVKVEAKKYGFKCVSDKYVNNQKSLDLECLECGNKYKRVISQIKHLVCRCKQ